jgi:hypothetical protein
LAGSFGFTISTSGVAPTTLIGVMSAIASNGIFLNTLGLITWLFDTMPSVSPSGAALTMAAVPVMPPAPGMFSITTGWPKALPSATEAARTMLSTPEPALIGRMKRIGLSEPCASAGSGAASAAAPAPKPSIARRSSGNVRGHGLVSLLF